MKKICWLLVTILLLTGFYMPGDVHATESAGSQTGSAKEEVIVNPLLKDYIDEEAAIAENLQWQEYAKSGIGFYSLDAYCDSLEEAAAYVRQQMIARVNSISVYVPRSVCSANDYLAVWDRALEHSETGSGQAGDSLAYGWKSLSRGYYWSGDYYEFKYNVTYRTTAEQEEQLTEAVDAALASLNLNGKSEYDKIKAIYNYICDHVNYDYTYSKYTPYHALCTGEAVCQGYAMLFYRMCKDAGLSVRIVDGIGNGGGHAWNIVRIGNEYFNLDSTWDGQDEETRSRWFLLNDADFLDHERDEEYTTEEFYDAYPMTRNSWVDYSSMPPALNRTNLEYSFGTVDGGTVSTNANGKPRLLVFYGVTSNFSKRIMDGFKTMDTTDIDVVAIEVSGSSGTEFNNFVADYSDTDIIFATNAVSGNNRNIMWEYIWFKYSGAISYPVVAFIDADNKVQDVLHSCGINNVKAGIDYYCYGNASPIAFLTQPVSKEAEKDGYAIFNVEARGNALTYQWQHSVDAGSSWTDISTVGAMPNIIMPGNAESVGWYRCQVKDGSGNIAYSDVATLEIKGLNAEIIAHPQDRNVEEGENATFAVTAAGEELKYQWQFRNSASGDWKDSGMTGAKTASITVRGTIARNGYQYRCVVTDASGKEVISNGATLTVTVAGPVITKQPASQSIVVGKNATFAVTATGEGLKYQWQFRTSASGSWKDSGMTGSQTANITVQGTTARNGYQYRCIITDRSGNKVTSSGATLAVTVAGPVITKQPASQSVVVGKNATFAVTATGEGLKYQWQFRTSESGSWKDSGMTGSQTASITVQGTAARNGYQYRCVVTDGSGNKVTSNGATLAVTVTGPVITNQPASQCVAVGGKAIFAVTATGEGLKYQWQFRTSESGSWKDSGMTGAKTASITVQGTTARNGYQYRCVVTDGNGNKVTSDGATLTVTVAGPVITKQPASQSVVVGENATFAVTATGEGLKYQWQFRTSESGSWKDSGMTGSQTASITVQGTAARNGYQYRCVVTDGNGNKVTSNGATLAVK